MRVGKRGSHRSPEVNNRSSDAREDLRKGYQDEAVARTYEEERDFREGDVSLHYETEVLALSEALGDVRAPVLEVAVGTGRLCRRLMGFGTRYVGIDVSAQMLKEAEKNLEYGTDHPRLIRGDAFQLPFRDGYFGAAIGFRFIKHLDTDGRRLMYKELKRVLADEGLLVFDFYGWRRRASKKKEGDRLTVGALRSELEENGLKLIKVYGTRHVICDIISVPFRWLKIRPAVQAAGWIGVKILSPLDELLDRSRGGIAVCKKS
ncbi:MAG: class I SAM-dependent methyltransferase [Candidatus Brocadiales bacterium]